MSLVSLVASSKFISFVSDGREIDSAKDIIISEKFKKITKINDKIIFSVTGNSGASKIINANLGSFCHDNAKAFAYSMFDMLGNGVLNRTVMFLIGGLDDNNNIYFTGFSENSTSLTDIILEDSAIRSGFAASDIANDKNARAILDECIKEITNFSTFDHVQALMIQTKFNSTISEFDKTVNKNIFHEYIYKK